MAKGHPAPVIEEIEGRHGTIRFFSKDTVIGAALRLYGEWAENELRFFQHFVAPGATVLDVGAFIGTHALAFSRMVGPEGTVISFEPQARSFTLLKENVRANERSNVQFHHAAVGAEPGRIRLEPMDIGDSINFGGLTIHEPEGDAESEEAEVVTIDGLGLSRCDFVKLDIEGSEHAALQGAAATIARLKPVIYAESNSLAQAARSFAILRDFSYALFLHVVDAFNPWNLGRAEHNIFGPAREAGLIAVPPDRREEIMGMTDPRWQLFELQTLDDLAYGMLQKPQYFDEVLRVSAAAKAGGAAVSAVENQNLRTHLAQVQQELDTVRNTLVNEAASFKTQIEARNREIGEAHDALETVRAKLEARDSELAEARDALSLIRESIAFRFVRPAINGENALRGRIRSLRHKLQPRIRDSNVQGSPLVLRVRPLIGDPPQAAVSVRPLLVCVSHFSPSPPRAGNEYRLRSLIRWLEAKDWDVLLLVCPLPGEEVSDIQIAALGRSHPNVVIVARDGSLRAQLARRDLADLVAGLEATPVRDFAALLKQEDAVTDQRLLALTRDFCPDVLMELLTAVDQVVRPAVIQVNYCFMTRSFPLLRAATLKIVDTHDVFSTKAAKVRRFDIADELVLTHGEERHLLRHADVVLAIQPDEAGELRNLDIRARVLTVGVDMPDPPLARQTAEQPVVLMVGSDNQLNRKGLNDFLRFAWPIVLQAVPDARFHVIGSVGKCLSGHEENVDWLGHVDDLNPVYAQARLVINPAVAGTGLKIKTLEALSQLRPIVLWPSGIDGISAELQVYCRCVRDWSQFAQSVVDALSDPEASNRLFDARDTIARLLSQDHLYAEYHTLLNCRR